MATATKAEFARIAGVTPGRVSQWLSEGKIGADALVGDGRFARIKVALALNQVRDRRDPTQSFANGLDTRLDGGVEVREPDSSGDLVIDALKQERLKALQLQNARLAEEALARRGIYVRADASKAAMVRLAGRMLTVFEASLNELAMDLAADLKVDQRTMHHKMRAAWRSIRLKVADAARKDAEAMPPLLEDDLAPDVSDPAGAAA